MTTNATYSLYDLLSAAHQAKVGGDVSEEIYLADYFEAGKNIYRVNMVEGADYFFEDQQVTLSADGCVTALEVLEEPYRPARRITMQLTIIRPMTPATLGW